MRPTPPRSSPPVALPPVTSDGTSNQSYQGIVQSKGRPDVSHFDKLPDAALISIRALAAVLGKGVSTAWRDVRNDPDFPKPIRLSAGCTRFRVGDIRTYMANKVSASAKPKRGQRMKGQVTP